jgi:tRNA G46 methylase TrmB
MLIDELIRLVYEKFQAKIPLGEQNQSQECSYENEIRIDWSKLSPHANPQAGDLPKNRVERKCQQIENFYYLFRKEIYLKRSVQQSKPLIVVDFCSGGGHLGIFLAYMFPDCQFKMIENKEESHELAIKRIDLLGIKNCHVFKVIFFQLLIS